MDFLRCLFEVPHTAPSASLFLETGCISINTIIKAKRINFLHYLVSEHKDKMLYKFFIAQWEQSTVDDWSHEVRKNLADFEIPDDLEWIKSKSKQVFSNLVKKKAKEYELGRLLKIKNTKSKMKNLVYVELKMQEYLELKNMTASQAKAFFKFRIRMAPFGENFRGGEKTIICPLCNKHPDGQEESFTCETLRKVINVQGNYKDIFRSKFPPELIKTIFNIFSFRDEYRKL